ncbi:MAG: hypothetical protein ACF8XB_08860 [Planctomycetota bacterium JB042]
MFLGNTDLRVKLSRSDSVALPNLMIAVSAEALWRLEPERMLSFCIEFADRLAGTGGVILKPSRVDLAVDVQGVDFPPASAPAWISRSRWKATYQVGDLVTGSQFGKGSLVVRIYEKTYELIQSRKDWMRAIWAHHGADPSRPVWRVEVQARRELLRRHGIDRLRRPEDLLGRLDALWSEALTRSLRLHDSRRSTRADKDPEHAAWKLLRRVSFAAATAAPPEPEPSLPSIDLHLRAIRGHLASIGGVLDLEDEEACVGATIQLLRELGEREPGEFQRRLNVRRAHASHVRALVAGKRGNEGRCGLPERDRERES